MCSYLLLHAYHMLSLDWTSLQEKINQDERLTMCNLDTTYLELWRVIGSSEDRPENFGTQEYFEAYERCNSLEPDHFVYHSSLAYMSNKTHINYRHVVEDEYMLRICPCSRRRHQRTHRVCDCQRSGIPMSPQCSHVFDIEPPKPRVSLPQDLGLSEPEEPSVMPWCRQYTDPKMLAFDERNKFSLTALLLNCTHLFITGTMASCTRIQPYDRISLSFHKLNNMTSDDCWPHRDFGDFDAVEREVRLYSKSPIEANYSSAIGEFTVIVGLAQDSKYCVIVEHVDHPYCTVHTDTEITIGHSHSKMPNICSAHMGKPVSTSTCSVPTPDIVAHFPLRHDRVFLIVVVCITLVLIGICMVTLRKWFCKKKQERKDKYDGLQKGIGDPLIPVTHPDMKPGAFSPKSKTKVFLIHFILDDNEDVRCKFLREWIKTIAQVDDLEDCENEESINEDPEGWVLAKLSAQDVRVVVVASVAVGHYLRASTTTSSEASRGGGNSTSSCTTSSTEVTSGSPTLSESSLNPDMSGSDTYFVEDEVEETSRALLSKPADFDGSLDPRNELRVFALKQIQKHLSGNYKQLAVVSFEKFCPVGENVASMLTPGKGPLVLPNHMSDLQDWVMSKKAIDHAHRPCCSQKNVAAAATSLPHRQNLVLGVTIEQCASSAHVVEDAGGDVLAAISVADQSTLAEQRLREVLMSDEFKDKL